MILRFNFKEKVKALDQEFVGDKWPISDEFWQELEKDELFFNNKTLLIVGESVSSFFIPVPEEAVVMPD